MIEKDKDNVRELGDGLILRKARPADREMLAEFHANILIDADEEPPAARLYYFVLDLMSDAHPLCGAEDFTVVEETASGKIVSSMVLMSQTWAYEGIPFKAGQPDIVSTDPAYRRRGLVRAQMAEIHRWSAERGELVQGITGIPWYYRQFGYEMALSLDVYRYAYRANVPQLNEGEAEPFAFRPATTDDLPFIMAMYEQAAARSAVAAVRDEALWRFDLDLRHKQNGTSSEIRVIEAREREGERVGLLVNSRKLWGEGLGVRLCEVKPGVPWLAVAPSVMRALDATGEAYARRDGGDFVNFGFDLVANHPLYDTIRDRLPKISPPYAWYLRVPDLPAFLSHIAPALERRLAASAQAGYSGEMTLNFFRSGIRLTFDAGRIGVASWTPERIEAGDALFPDLSFLPLLFGFRSLEEIQCHYPDCSTATDEARALLPILFPKKDSRVWSGG
jgi:GNAT superfamily N-acetyltransferase